MRRGLKGWEGLEGGEGADVSPQGTEVGSFLAGQVCNYLIYMCSGGGHPWDGTSLALFTT